MIELSKASPQMVRTACRLWHYSRSVPAGAKFRLSARERERWIGILIFGKGTNLNMFRPFGLDQREGLELQRVALRDHETPVSQVVAAALRIVHSTDPSVRLIVSYADPARGHHGGIYQAGNWVYLGSTSPSRMWINENGKVIHQRQMDCLHSLHDRPNNWTAIQSEPKHRYGYPLDRKMRRQLQPLALPYPHAVQVSEE